MANGILPQGPRETAPVEKHEGKVAEQCAWRDSAKSKESRLWGERDENPFQSCLKSQRFQL